MNWFLRKFYTWRLRKWKARKAQHYAEYSALQKMRPTYSHPHEALVYANSVGKVQYYLARLEEFVGGLDE